MRSCDRYNRVINSNNYYYFCDIHDDIFSVEYRTLSSSGQLFSQNQTSDAACFLLKGRVEMRMEGIAQKHAGNLAIAKASEVFQTGS